MNAREPFRIMGLTVAPLGRSAALALMALALGGAPPNAFSANDARPEAAQSCAARDHDPCVDQAVACLRDCDTLERCTRRCCQALKSCLASHGCRADAPFCAGG